MIQSIRKNRKWECEARRKTKKELHFTKISSQFQAFSIKTDNRGHFFVYLLLFKCWHISQVDSGKSGMNSVQKERKQAIFHLHIRKVFTRLRLFHRMRWSFISSKHFSMHQSYLCQVEVKWKHEYDDICACGAHSMCIRYSCSSACRRFKNVQTTIFNLTLFSFVFLSFFIIWFLFFFLPFGYAGSFRSLFLFMVHTKVCSK